MDSMFEKTHFNEFLMSNNALGDRLLNHPSHRVTDCQTNRVNEWPNIRQPCDACDCRWSGAGSCISFQRWPGRTGQCLVADTNGCCRASVALGRRRSRFQDTLTFWKLYILKEKDRLNMGLFHAPEKGKEAHRLRKRKESIAAGTIHSFFFFIK